MLVVGKDRLEARAVRDGRAHAETEERDLTALAARCRLQRCDLHGAGGLRGLCCLSLRPVAKLRQLGSSRWV